MLKRTSFRLIPYLSYIFCIIVLFYIFGYIFFIKPLANSFSSFHTSPILNLEQISTGYTLVAPYNRMANVDPQFKGKIYLLDLLGNPVHTWTIAKQPLYSQLQKNGNLLVVMESPSYTQPLPPGGNTGTIQEIDWNSNIVWEFKNEAMHHDFITLPNGNIILSLWEQTPNSIASQIKGGTPDTTLQGVIFSDYLVEINRQGKIVWSWHSYENLNSELDVVGSLMPQFAWTYANGLSYSPHNPIDGTEAIIVSMRSLNKIVIVRKKDGKIIWRSPDKMLNTQHDPTILKNGNILVFDNGFAREPNPFPSYGSRVVEIDPRINKIVWQFDGGQGVIDKVRFFAPLVSGAQRLPNGNTLITDGPRGHIFEVTKNKELVWDLISPYYTQQTGIFPNNFIFKTRRYKKSEINWPEKLPPPLPIYPLQYLLYQILNPLYVNQYPSS